MYESSKEAADSEDRMLAWAQSYLDLHKDVEKNYTEKYEQYKIGRIKQQSSDEEVPIQVAERSILTVGELPVEETDIFKELKKYRLDTSREEKIKPYFIYNDNQLRDLISKMPRNKEELLKVAGFGDIKTNKYGDDILKIMKKY